MGGAISACETCAKCRGCGALIHFDRVRPGEDDTTPWRATLPAGHTFRQSIPELLYYYCRKSGDGLAVQPPKFATISEPASVDKVATWLAPDGSGDLLIELADGSRFRQSGDQVRRLPHRNEGQTVTWLDYHDRLVKEWFDGERALVDDLYPDVPKKVEEPIYRPFAPGEVRVAKLLGVFALFVAVIFISTLYLWA